MRKTEEILTELYEISKAIDQIVVETDYVECERLKLADLDDTDANDIFISNEISRILDTLTSIQGNIDYINRPVSYESKLFRNSFGKYETREGHWYSCGSVIEYLCHDETKEEHPFWRKASVEHNDTNYYITGDTEQSLDDILVRVRKVS